MTEKGGGIKGVWRCLEPQNCHKRLCFSGVLPFSKKTGFLAARLVARNFTRALGYANRPLLPLPGIAVGRHCSCQTSRSLHLALDRLSCCITQVGRCRSEDCHGKLSFTPLLTVGGDVRLKISSRNLVTFTKGCQTIQNLDKIQVWVVEMDFWGTYQLFSLSIQKIGGRYPRNHFLPPKFVFFLCFG